MKIFPSSFEIEKNRTDGSAPLWILKIIVNAVSYYLSDVAVTVPDWSIITKAWVKEWGNLTEGVTGLIDEFKIAGFSAVCFADPDAVPNIIDLANAYNLEKELASLYLWFADSTDPPQEMFRGYIRDYPISEGDTLCSLQLQDESLAWQETYVGRKLSQADYPDADPDDVGKVIPIPYGTVTKVPALAIEAGVITTMAADVSLVAVTLTVSRSSGLNGTVIMIDEEELLVTAVSGNDITVTRGYNSSIAAAHNKGASVAVKKSTPLVYLASDVPIDSYGRVQVLINEQLIDVTADCYLFYTGQSGYEHPSYPGKAVVLIPDLVRIKKNIKLAAGAAGLNVNEGYHDHAASADVMVTVDLQTAFTFTGPISNPEYAVDGDWSTAAILSASTSVLYVTRQNIFTAPGTPVRYRLCMYYKDGTGGPLTSWGAWTALTTWASLTALTRAIYGTTVARYVYAAWFEVEYTPTVTASGATGVALSGNSMVDTVIGSALYIDMTRTMAAPINVFHDLAVTWAGAAGFSQNGTLPASYDLNFVINEYRRIEDWLHDLAWQVRCWLRHSCGVWRLTFREAEPNPYKTLTSCRIEGGKRLHNRDKSAYSEVINTITLLYGRDWQQTRSDKAYAASVKDTNAASITDFGEQERPELFLMDAVTDSAHAADLLAYYLDWYSSRHWLHTIESDYRDSELDFGDPVNLAFAGAVDTIVINADIKPGCDTVTLKLIQ